MGAEPLQQFSAAHAELGALALQARSAYLAHPVPSLAERSRPAQPAAIRAREQESDHRGDLRRLRQPLASRDAVRRDLHRDRWCRPRIEAPEALDEAAETPGGPPQLRTGAKNVIPQPLGVVGVIVPMELPLNLSILPLVYIFAAGNLMVKMSENSSATSRGS